MRHSAMLPFRTSGKARHDRDHAIRFRRDLLVQRGLARCGTGATGRYRARSPGRLRLRPQQRVPDSCRKRLQISDVGMCGQHHHAQPEG